MHPALPALAKVCGGACVDIGSVEVAWPVAVGVMARDEDGWAPEVW